MKNYVVGIDLGGTNIKAGLFRNGELVHKNSVKTGKERQFDDIVQDMAKLVLDICDEMGISTDDVAGIGMGMPGTIDVDNGVIVYCNNIRIKNYDIRSKLYQLTGINLYIANDADVAALGEARFGAGKGMKNLVFVTLGTGVGTGIIIDGKIITGNKSAGCELGHMVIKYGGTKCTCGRKGCFEVYASATGLIRETICAMEQNKQSLLWKLSPSLDTVGGRTVFDAMRMGDDTAAHVVDQYIEYLACGLVNYANGLRPEAIMIGGGVCGQGDVLLKPLKEKFNSQLYGGTDYAPVDLRIAQLGNDAGMYGAYCLVSDAVSEGK